MTEEYLDAEDLRLVNMGTKCVVCGKTRGAHFSYQGSNGMVTYCEQKNTDEWNPFRRFIENKEKKEDNNPNMLFKGEV